ncbi:MAG: hypothetical protein GX913_02345 [Clostridiales bacterium]|nr:hypothetical protein [Clostridiales bacterium]
MYKNSRASTIVILICTLLFCSLWYLNVEKILKVFSINYPLVYIIVLFGGILLIINYSFLIVERFFVHKGSATISENNIVFNLRFFKKVIELDDLYDVDYIEIVPKKAVDNIGYRLIIEYTVNVKGKTKKLFLDTPGKIEKKESELYQIYSSLINK